MVKNGLILGFLSILLLITILYRNSIVDFITRALVTNEKPVLAEANDYYKDYDYLFVQNTTNLYPNNKQDILNILYTALNRGSDRVTFYCPYKYDSCIDDFNDIIDNKIYLSAINNLVHPFNSYRNIYFSVNNYGKINIMINKTYSEADIYMINKKIDEISESIFTPYMNNYDKIMAFHDYIIDNTIYDESADIKDDNFSIDNNSNTAIGVLFNGVAICSGYSDVMAIFLNRLGFNNYKISSINHIWNLVYLDNNWMHIDATWDDPITSNGSNIILHDFFLINTYDLIKKDSGLNREAHNFDSNIYFEAK